MKFNHIFPVILVFFQKHSCLIIIFAYYKSMCLICFSICRHEMFKYFTSKSKIQHISFWTKSPVTKVIFKYIERYTDIYKLNWILKWRRGLQYCVKGRRNWTANQNQAPINFKQFCSYTWQGRKELSQNILLDGKKERTWVKNPWF